MPSSRFSGSLSSPMVEFFDVIGNLFLNRVVDGFLKIGAVGATRAAVEEFYYVCKRGSLSKDKFKHSLKKVCKEGAYWGTVAGVYVGLEYGVERTLSRSDWNNAMIGGALTGALMSAAFNNKKDKVFVDAITGSAVATAAEFLNYLT